MSEALKVLDYANAKLLKFAKEIDTKKGEIDSKGEAAIKVEVSWLAEDIAQFANVLAAFGDDSDYELE